MSSKCIVYLQLLCRVKTFKHILILSPSCWQTFVPICGREPVTGFQHHGQMPAELSSSGREDFQHLGQRHVATRHTLVNAPVCWETPHHVVPHLFIVSANLFLSVFLRVLGSQSLSGEMQRDTLDRPQVHHSALTDMQTFAIIPLGI